MKRYLWIFFAVWTCCIAASLTWDIVQQRKNLHLLAYVSADLAIQKDTIYRKWVSLKGGVYVPQSTTAPNKYLIVPHRDITASDGLKLTLVNPAYMTRQVNELAKTEKLITGNLTSLKPINPGNNPDEWERKALRGFEKGEKEISGIDTASGSDIFRLMRPFVADQSCLKCHESQGYKPGDIKGGISSSINMQPFYAIERQVQTSMSLAHSLIWILGIAGIAFFFNRLSAKNDKIRVSEYNLRERMKELQNTLRRLELLTSLAGDLLTMTDPQKFVKELCTRVMEQLDCHVFFNFIVDDKDVRLHLNSYAGITDEEARRIEWLEYGVAVCGCAARDGCRIVTENILTVPDPRTELVKSYGIRAYACHPLQVSGGNVIGTLSFGTRTRDTFCDDDLSLMKAVADQVTGAMIRVQTQQMLQQKNNDLLAANAQLNEVLNDQERSRLSLLSILEDEKQARKEIADSEEKFRSIMENSADAIFITDQSGKYIYTNKAVTDMLGFTPDEMMSKTIIDMAPKERINEYLDHFKSVLNTGKGFGEIEFLKKDGTYVPTDLNAVILPDGMVYGSSRDISERIKTAKELELYRENLELLVTERTEELITAIEKAEEANVSKSRFLANMSHEIRTPLNAVLGFSQLMLRDPVISEKQKERLAIINRSGENLLLLINDILEISKIEAGKITINSSVFNLDTLLSDIESMFRTKIEAKKLTFILEKSEDTPQYINTDETKLRQILINLIGNAVKFTHEGGISARVKTVQNEKVFLMIEVEDSGTGIEKNDLKRLFKVFEQTAEGSKMGGTGLGLALSRHFAQLLGGDITATSEVNKGSIFSLKINILTAEDADIKKTMKKIYITGLKPGQKQFKLLVVDDKLENRLFLSELLQEFGFDVMDAADGKESIIRFKEFKPDLVFMDINMPVMNGNEAIEQIRNIDKNKNVPIVAVTASVFEEDRQKILKTGINGYIRKPFKDYEIFDIIKATLGVEYIYKEDEVVKEYSISEIKKILENLPEALADQIVDSASQAEMISLLNHISEASKIIPEIGPYLQQLAKEYKYDIIIQLLSKKEE
jgi:PAS domain S-box-containing protein